MLFIQGAGANVHEGWDRALVDSLERELGCEGRYPRMPDEADPHYAAWKPALLAALANDIVVVGHSVGGTMLLHALAEADVTPRAVALIAAPFIGEGGWPSDELPARTHFELAAPVFLYHGTADQTVPLAHLTLYARALPGATVRVLPDRDHQLNNDLSDVARDLRAFVTRR